MDSTAIGNRLRRVVESGGYPFGIAATSDGTVLATVGSSEKLESDDLRRTLFGDGPSIAMLYSSLDGQLLPRIWSQGSVRCAVYKPEPGTVVGIFAQKNSGAVQMYREFAALAPRLHAGA